MRKDGNRVIVYPNIYAQFNRSFNFAWRIVHPRAALVISMFDGQRTKDDVVEIWKSLNGYGDGTAKVEVEKVLKDYEDIMYESKTLPKEYRSLNPEELVCNMANLDYSVSRLNIPYSVLYMPTMHCGHSCRYCYADIQRKPDPNELSLAELERIMDEIEKIKCAEVSISGGDPFLRKDIYEVLDLIFSRGFTSDVPTKSPLTEKQIQKLVDIGIKRIQISLDSPFDAEVVEFLTGRKDYFHKVRNTLMMLGEAGFEVGITCVVVDQTIDSIPRQAEFYADLGFVNRVSFSQVGASIYRKFPELYSSTEKLEKMDEEIQNLNGRYSHIFLKSSYLKDPYFMTNEERAEFFKTRPTCSGGKWAFTILPDGKVTLCEELYYHPAFIVGDLKEQTIREMWHSPEMLKVVEPDQDEFAGSPCYNCDMFYECHTGKGRCWKRALKAFGDRPNAPYWPDPYCPKAPRINERLS